MTTTIYSNRVLQKIKLHLALDDIKRAFEVIDNDEVPVQLSELGELHRIQVIVAAMITARTHDLAVGIGQQPRSFREPWLDQEDDVSTHDPHENR